MKYASVSAEKLSHGCFHNPRVYFQHLQIILSVKGSTWSGQVSGVKTPLAGREMTAGSLPQPLSLCHTHTNMARQWWSGNISAEANKVFLSQWG